MPRDYPDGAAPIYQIAVKQSDMSQLFLAIMHFLPLDTRGRMVWLSKFDDPSYAEELSHAGDGVNPVSDTVYPYIGNYALKMDSGTLGGGGSSAARYRLFASVGQQVGFEVMYRYGSGSGKLVLNVYWLTSSLCRRGRLTVDPETGDVYVGPTTALQLVGNIGTPAAVAVWLPVKFVVDFDTQKLMRVMFGNSEIDLSDYDTVSTTLTGNNQLVFEINSYGWGTGTKISYIGYELVTLDEP